MDEQYKFVRYADSETTQLFDLQNDPWETRNLAGDPEHAATLEEETARLVVPLPPIADFGLYEVRWQFAHAECDRPGACYSARLLGARLEGSPADGQ